MEGSCFCREVTQNPGKRPPLLARAALFKSGQKLKVTQADLWIFIPGLRAVDPPIITRACMMSIIRSFLLSMDGVN